MPAVNFLPALNVLPTVTRSLLIILLTTSTLAFLLRINSTSSSLRASPSSFPTGADTHITRYGLFHPAPREDYPWLFCVPGKVFYYPWTILIAGFAEGNLVEFLISVVSLPLCGRYLERIWGGKELAKFTFVVIVASNVIAIGLSWILYFVLGAEVLVYGSTVHGLSALQVGFLVAFTQLIPEHQVQIFGGLIKIRVKNIPGIYLLISNVLTFVIAQNPYIIIQFGFFSAWVYLRFVKYQEGSMGEFRGDRSDTFQFVNWFPPIIHRPISFLANTVFNLFVALRLVQPYGASAEYALLPGPSGGAGARAEAERRRALALKALDARMATGTGTPGSSSAGPATPMGSGPGASSSSNGAVNEGDQAGSATASKEETR
ncbi:Predicted membrane protein [Phaffia rhodozyma]|uniref:Predicted membrane protein n=1 Tax=Phaffia rhodozyma TaxID=264483 RepID=A0A0F7SG71_PHARH|nr:Predicted membrane protein [Phaffia rhodozyma]